MSESGKVTESLSLSFFIYKTWRQTHNSLKIKWDVWKESKHSIWTTEGFLWITECLFYDRHHAKYPDSQGQVLKYHILPAFPCLMLSSLLTKKQQQCWGLRKTLTQHKQEKHHSTQKRGREKTGVDNRSQQAVWRFLIPGVLNLKATHDWFSEIQPTSQPLRRSNQSVPWDS